MESFYSQHNKLSLVETCTPDLPITENLQEFWKLDEKMRQAFLPHLAMWEQGLITSVDLLNRLTIEFHAPRKL